MLYNEVNQLYVYMYPLPPSHCSRSLQSAKLSSLCYTDRRFPLASCFTHGSVYMSILIFQFIPPSPSPLCPHICSLCLCLYSCLGNGFIHIIFFFFRLHLYVLIHDICFSDLLHCMTNSRPITPLGMRGIEGIDSRQDWNHLYYLVSLSMCFCLSL